jgi:hypothetical protein
MVACNVKREERERPVTLGRELGTSASGSSGGGRARILQTEDYARAVISRSVKLDSPVQENLHDLHADQDDQDDDARASRDQVAQEQL